MTSRDPGKIAGAFNASAESVRRLRERAYTMNNPESEAAMRAEANAGKTSRRSPARPSAAMRSRLTGVTENVDQQGWIGTPTAMPHLCFPPDTYPLACGPGSHWRCRCGALWVSAGILWSEYPQTPRRSEQPLGPERWHYVGDGQLPEDDYRAQENLYDWRPLGPYYVKLYRAMIDNQKFSMGWGREPVSWEDLG